jgi:hypothetical protein
MSVMEGRSVAMIVRGERTVRVGRGEARCVVGELRDELGVALSVVGMERASSEVSIGSAKSGSLLVVVGS